MDNLEWLPLPPGLDPILAELANEPIPRCTFPLASRERGRGEGLGDPLNRREQILENAPRAEVDLGADPHAGDEA